jgi:hypothetical protein
MSEGTRASIESASRWVRPYLITGWEFRRSVTAIEHETLTTFLVRWLGKSRRIERHCVPTNSSARKLQEPCVSSEFNPWQEDPQSLPARTHRLVRCPSCEGERKATCSVCDGLGFTPCYECGGRGSVFSHRSRRMIRCPGCRGRGESKCSCRSGLVACESCSLSSLGVCASALPGRNTIAVVRMWTRLPPRMLFASWRDRRMLSALPKLKVGGLCRLVCKRRPGWRHLSAQSPGNG